jgi:hypothetical protein
VDLSIQNTNGGTNAQAGFSVLNDLGNYFQGAMTSSTNSNFIDTAYFNTNCAGGMRFYSQNSSPVSFGTSNGLQMQINSSTGNAIFDNTGAFVDDGSQLQAKGTASAEAFTTDSGTTNWQLGGYTSGVLVQAGSIQVTINGTTYNLLTS